MKQAGAGYVVFTTHQRTRFLIAPNATFDRLTGYKPGEACSHRDLIADLADALDKRGIPMMLYWTGNGPSSDPKASKALGFTAPVTKQWAEIWGSVYRTVCKVAIIHRVTVDILCYSVCPPVSGGRNKKLNTKLFS